MKEAGKFKGNGLWRSSRIGAESHVKKEPNFLKSQFRFLKHYLLGMDSRKRSGKHRESGAASDRRCHGCASLDRDRVNARRDRCPLGRLPDSGRECREQV